MHIHTRLVPRSGFAQSDQLVGDHVNTGGHGDGDHLSLVCRYDHLVGGILPCQWTNVSPGGLRGGSGQWGQRVVVKSRSTPVGVRSSLDENG